MKLKLSVYIVIHYIVIQANGESGIERFNHIYNRGAARGGLGRHPVFSKASAEVTIFAMKMVSVSPDRHLTILCLSVAIDST